MTLFDGRKLVSASKFDSFDKLTGNNLLKIHPNFRMIVLGKMQKTKIKEINKKQT